MVISERVRKLAAEGGWIGVDFDGTLFTYDDWVPWNQFGEPIMPMIERVLAWTLAGVGVRIFTARVGLPVAKRRKTPGFEAWGFDIKPTNICRVTGQCFSDQMMIKAIRDHSEKHGLPRLPVQCHKEVDMIEFWDDRAIQVIANTGRTLAEELEAERAAQRGKQFSGAGNYSDQDDPRTNPYPV